MAAADTTALELPTFRGVPGWEFTPIDKLDLDAHPAAGGGTEGRDVVAAPAGAIRLGADALPEGVRVLELREALERHPELVEPHLGSVVAPDTIFTARNAGAWTDGHFVHVARGVTVTEPIVLTTVHEQGGSTLYHRTLVVLEEGAQAEVRDQFVSSDDEHDGVLNSVVELVLGQNARLRYIGAQDLNEQTWIFGSERGIVGRDAALEWVTLGFGAANGKVFLETKLDGPGADAQVTGAYATRGRQHLDFDTLQEHAAPNTTSDLAYRGILGGRSSAVWRGMIQVDSGAQNVDAFQESRNLLLTRKAHADAIPGLEILANDVRCTHAAAIAQIDKDQLFYLRSHGLPDATAKRLVIEGFLGALVERLPEGDTRDAVATVLEERLAAVLG